jgi:hypothetical protein
VGGKTIWIRFRNDSNYDIFTWTDPASPGSNLGSNAMYPFCHDLMLVKLENNSTTRKLSIAPLRAGLRGDWIELLSHAAGTFLTEDSVSITLLSSNGSPTIVDVEHFDLQ